MWTIRNEDLRFFDKMFKNQRGGESGGKSSFPELLKI